MESPSERLRDQVLTELTRLEPATARGREADDIVSDAFNLIADELASSVEKSEQVVRVSEAAVRLEGRGHAPAEEMADADDLLATVHEWAGLASYVLASVYGPASPMPRNLAGWGKKAIARLQQITRILLTPLRAAATVTGASSWSISVGFPWGVSIGLAWP